MFLKKLTISGKHGIIREISFNKGLNLIVNDPLPTKDITESGNDIGKTTFLRVVDWCFGSDGKDIYTDHEYKQTNSKVYDFLITNEVAAELVFEVSARRFVIRRSFGEDAEYSINQESYRNITEFKKALEKQILRIEESRPSIRQVMPKFIRKDHATMANVTKFLHTTTKVEEYERVFLFLFGITDSSLLAHRSYYQKEITSTKKKLDTFLKERPITTSRQAIALLDHEIEEIEQKKQEFEVVEAYEAEIENLGLVQAKIAELSQEIGSLELRVSLSKQTLEELRRNFSQIDVQSLRAIYEEAGHLIPDLQKSFEELLTFHNQMTRNKLRFVSDSIQETENQLTARKQTLQECLQQESVLLKNLTGTKTTFSEYEALNRKLTTLHEKRGQISGVLNIIEELQKKLHSDEQKLQELDKRLSEYQENFDKRLTQYNFIFAEYSRKLYDEDYFLSYEQKDQVYRFRIDNITGNVGEGKKKGQIAAFDLAYLRFLEEAKLPLFRFVMHNSIEDIDNNQIKTLFDIANSLKGQYFVSIIRNRIEFLGQEYIDAHCILQLSPNDKFFRIETPQALQLEELPPQHQANISKRPVLEAQHS
jgi:uncharacterized protein YydD (DUF2326 family)